MQNIETLISQIVSNKFKNGEILKHVRGKVVSVEDNDFAKVNVQNKEITLINKSGEELATDDEVTIHYWTNIGNGYIALRHGLSNLQAGVLSVDRAAILTSKQNSLLTAASETIDTDSKNNVTVNYGDNNNTIFVNGFVANPITVSDISSTSSAFINMVNSIPTALTYNEVELLEVNDAGDLYSQRYYTTVSTKTYMANYNEWWYYGCCMKEGVSGALLTSPNQYYRSNPSSGLRVALFYKNIYSPNLDGISSAFKYGAVDLLLVYISNSMKYAEIQCGFSSSEEFEYALSATSKSDVEKVE